MANLDEHKIKALMQESLLDFWENFLEPNMATKEDLKSLATKEELEMLSGDLNKVASDVKDIKRRLLDVESDTPTRREFNQLKLGYS